MGGSVLDGPRSCRMSRYPACGTYQQANGDLQCFSLLSSHSPPWGPALCLAQPMQLPRRWHHPKGVLLGSQALDPKHQLASSFLPSVRRQLPELALSVSFPFPNSVHALQILGRSFSIPFSFRAQPRVSGLAHFSPTISSAVPLMGTSLAAGVRVGVTAPSTAPGSE